MTIDDESSIYVGGLPYNSTEENLRRVFDIYGAVVAVKIINDRGVGGKCYGFVTFTNPRSAGHAIEDMDGKTIDGRVVKVNEVKSRGGRLNYGREGFRRNSERGLNWDRSRDRERDYDYDRERYRDGHREHSRDRDQDKERGYEHARDHDRTRDHFVERDRSRDQDRRTNDVEQEHERYYNKELERDRDQDRVIKRTSDHRKDGETDNDEMSRLPNGSNISDRRSRELSLGSIDDEVEKELESSNQKVDELQKEISEMEESAEEKRELVLKLREKSQKLEDALATAKKLTSQRNMQLTKLHKCFVHVKDYSERVKSSEQELQSLVDSTMLEIEFGGDVGVRDGIVANCKT